MPHEPMTNETALREAAIALRDDMLMRAKANAWQNDGETVVEAGAGVWARFCNVLQSPSQPVVAEGREPCPDLFDLEHDEAWEWITANCMAVRRDNGNMDYSFGAMIKAYEAGKAAAHPQASPPPVQSEATEEQIEAAAKAHCDFFGGQGWWDSGLIADTKPKALEAMRAAIASLAHSQPDTQEGEHG